MPEPPGFGLAALLDPVSPTVFFRDYWEEKPLLVRRNRPDYYAPLLSTGQIEQLITATDLPPSTLTVANADVPLSASDLARADSTLDIVKVHQLFAAGATLVLQEAHKWVAPLAALCRILERDISAPFQTNLYMTPAGGRGFETHYDTHDVFVLQIEGTKAWTIFDSPVRLPLRGQPFDPALHPVGAATLSCQLEPGDFLYIPRGYLHQARSGDATSLHATLGAICYRWADVLLEVMAEACLSDPAFRRALPIGLARAGFKPDAARKTFAGLLARLIDTATPDRVLDRLADEFVLSRRALLPGQLEQLGHLPALSAADEVGPRPGLIYRLRTDGDIVRLRCYGRETRLPVAAAQALRFALETTRYQIADLPGKLDRAEKLMLVRRLIEEGLVVRHPPD
ncbi:MAG: hypothetical protein HY060_13335 [Proteobacteria bacterium]|nr:hypothetical protein [Pseudomonadota bacterium]